MKPEVACSKIASQQHWAISRNQAIAAGMTPRMIGHRLKLKSWRLELPKTYVVGAAQSTWMQRLFAAWLWAGPDTLVSHRAAGALWELDGCPSDFVEVSSPRHIRSDSVLVHELHSTERRFRRGLPVTSIEETILDLSSLLPEHRLERAIDHALRKNLTTIDRLRRPLLRSGRAKDGATKLNRLLSERRDLGSGLESRLETEFMRFVQRQDLPMPMAQVRIIDGSRCLARVDFMYPEVGLVIEVDGYEFHSGKVRWQRDMWRGNELTVRGLRTLRFSRADLFRAPNRVASQILAAYRCNAAG